MKIIPIISDIFLAIQIAAFVIFGIGAFLVWQVGGYRKRGFQMTGYWLVCIGYGGSFLAFIYIEKLLAVSYSKLDAFSDEFFLKSSS